MDQSRGTLRQRPDIVCKSAGRETLLYDPVRDSIHILNPTARLVWELCDGQHTPTEIEAALRARFAPAPEQDVAGDIQAVLELFEAEGLITRP